MVSRYSVKCALRMSPGPTSTVGIFPHLVSRRKCEPQGTPERKASPPRAERKSSRRSRTSGWSGSVKAGSHAFDRRLPQAHRQPRPGQPVGEKQPGFFLQAGLAGNPHQIHQRRDRLVRHLRGREHPAFFAGPQGGSRPAPRFPARFRRTDNFSPRPAGG